MNALSQSLGRLQSMRRRESKKNSVQPIDVDAAKQYHHAGPCSSASSSLLTPRPRHYRTSSSNTTTPSPATPRASTFAASAPSSARIVSSPTFVSSSALAPASGFHTDFDALTPPLSPVHPNSAAAAQATKSPLRRALSRTLFFASSHSNASANPQPTTPRISSPLPTTTEAATVRARRPARPTRPATSPATESSPQLHAFGSTIPSMSVPQTNAHPLSSPRRSMSAHDDAVAPSLLGAAPGQCHRQAYRLSTLHLVFLVHAILSHAFPQLDRLQLHQPS